MLPDELCRECEGTFEAEVDRIWEVDGLREATKSIGVGGCGVGAEAGEAMPKYVGGLVERRSCSGLMGSCAPNCIGKPLLGKEVVLMWPWYAEPAAGSMS